MSPRQRNTDAVWIDVLPSLLGFGAAIAKAASGSGTKAGKTLAVELERAAEKAGKVAGERLGDGIAAAEARVEQLSRSLQNARDKEADAAGKVRIAEEKLNEVRAKGEKATKSQILAAEENLAKARRTAAAATTDIERAERNLADAELAVANATDEHTEAVDRGTGSLDKYSERMGTAARMARQFGLSSVKAAAGAAAIGSAAPLVGGLAVAAMQASAAALVLPGALTAGGIAAGVLKLGLSGLSEALGEWDDPEKFAEAIADLSPAGQSAMIAIRDLRPELIGLRNDVQEGILAGLDEEIESLSGTYLPVLRSGLRGVGEEFGQTRSDLAAFLADARTIDDVALLMSQSETAAGDLGSAVVPLASVFRDVAAVGGGVFTDFTAGAGGSAQALADFIAQARASGDLESWIRTGIATAGQFLAIIGDIGQIVSTVFAAADAQGAGILNTISMITGSVVALLTSVEGHQALTAFFAAVRQVVENLLPGLQAVAGVILQGVIQLAPELPPVAAGFSAVAIALSPLILDLVQLVVTILPPLVALITWLSPALPVLAAGFAAGALALKAYTIINAIIGWYRAWAAAQFALNAAMSANPIGLIIAAVAALVGVFIYLWNNSEGFRNFWIGMWEAIKTAALWVWENALKPTWDAIVAALQWVGENAMAFWNDYLKPAFTQIGYAAMAAWSVLSTVFDAIWTGLKYLGAIIFTIFVLPYVFAFKIVSAIAIWLWETVLRPVITAIGEFFGWLWTTWISPVVDFIVAKIQLFGAVIMLLWSQYVQPALTAIGDFFSWLWSAVISIVVDLIMGYIRLWATVITWLWESVIQPVFRFIGDAVSAVGAAFGWVYANVIKPAWDALGAAINWVWLNVLSPVFNAIKGAVHAVGQAFDEAVNFISSVWDKIKAIAARPVNFVIETVYNNGIRGVWNKVAEFVGLASLPALSPISFAGGGVLPGYEPGRDTVPALLSRGEAVLVPELVRMIGAKNILAANAAASGRPPGGTGGYAGGGVARFAGGGIVGSLLDWVSGIGDDIVRLWKDPVGAIKAAIGSTGWADMLARTPAKLIAQGADWLWSKIKGFFGFSSDAAASAAASAGGTPMGWQQMWQIISSQFPAAILTSAYRPGDPGYHGKGRAIDIAGPMDAINAWIAKVYPHSTQLIYTPGANILNGRPFTYDAPTRSDHFDHVHWAFDSGGYLEPGLQLVYNGTGKPERVLTDEQWAQLGAENGMNGLSLVGAVAELRGDGLLQFVDGRIERHSHNTGSALARRTR